ncbi:unnamed protein product [Nezara viridula]|uniref:Uncharacterized protein n=1 Tax=Nezara viridula TaxID=85310 RepID=A0A9P0EE18_NEZVI|nr:unnamed protein product [Nezara viridula]
METLWNTFTGIKNIFQLNPLRTDSQASLISANSSIEQGLDNPQFDNIQKDNSSVSDFENNYSVLENESITHRVDIEHLGDESVVESVSVVEEQPTAAADSSALIPANEVVEEESICEKICWWIAVLVDAGNLI